MDEPIRIYLTCYYVLEGCGDDRANIMLQRAHERLMSNVEKISDPATRVTFLDRVPAHRELTELWNSRKTEGNSSGKPVHE